MPSVPTSPEQMRSHLAINKQYSSRFAIGERVQMGFVVGDARAHGVVVAVKFTTHGKVLYDLDLDHGGETFREIDSAFVHSDHNEAVAK